MSVGGKVVQTYLRKEDNQLWVNTHDGSDYCAVYVDGIHDVAVGTDTLWWQGGTCYWTRRDSDDNIVFQDMKIIKKSGSGVSHPLGPIYEVKHDFYPAFKQKREQFAQLKARYEENFGQVTL
jgi:hypothetical protein